MNEIYSILAPAKLNLNLFVKDKSSNGLYLLESDICFLELTDKICFRFNKEDLFIQSSKNKALKINNKNNLILESVDAFRQLTGWKKKFWITLDKNIPVGGGLGGGSANAAATLILLRRLFNKENKSRKVPISNLYKLGNKLGSDIPACLLSKSLKLRGYGNIISRNSIPNNYYYLIINPNINLSTKDVFLHFGHSSKNKLVNSDMYFENIKIYNSLLSSAIFLAPSIITILLKLKKIPNIIAYGMTGSGSTCFGVFNSLKNILPFLKIFGDEYFIWYGKKKDYSLNRVRFSKMLEKKF